MNGTAEPFSEASGEIDPHPPLLFLYSTQGSTKTSETTCVQLNTQAMEYEFESRIAPIKLYDKAGFLTAPYVFLLLDTATPNDDGVPESAKKLWDVLNTTDLPTDWLRDMRFSVITLGPWASWTDRLLRRLCELGAEHVFESLSGESGPHTEAGVLEAFSAIWLAFPSDDFRRPHAKLPKKPRAKVDSAPQPPLAPSEEQKQGTVTLEFHFNTADERLGVQWQGMGSEISCRSVRPNSVAQRAGVAPGMKLLELDGVPVTGEVTLMKCITRMREKLHGVAKMQVPPKTAEQPAEEEAVADKAQEALLTRDERGKLPVVLMYASQTGNAEAICKELNKEVASLGYPTRCGPCDSFQKLEWDQCKGGLVLVVSTTGDGEVPDNGKKFCRFLKKKAVGQFPHVRYCMLALGDQNYDRFCNAGKAMAALLGEAGCVPIEPMAEADDGTGLEIVVEPWRSRLPSLLEECARPYTPALATPPAEAEGEAVQPTQAKDVPASTVPERSAKKVLLLYGSETGNAEAIARNIAEVISGELSLPHTLAPANKFNQLEWLTYPILICVIATTGDGEMCDNAKRFWRHLKNHSPVLTGMHYTVLALGDQNYAKFCGAGKVIDKRLEELGANRFYPIGLADDGVGLEIVVEPWKQKLFPNLAALWGTIHGQGDAPAAPELSDRGYSPDPERPVAGEKVDYSDSRHGQLNPFYAKIASWTKMSETEPPAYKISFDVAEWNAEWTPGDAIGILPCNDEEHVDALLTRLDVSSHEDFLRPASLPDADPDAMIYQEMRFPLTNRQVLLRHVDLFVRRKELLRFLMHHCSDEGDRALLAQWCTSAMLFHDQVCSARLTLKDVLDLVKSCKPPFRRLVEHCHPLQPRYYSVASAYVHSPTRLDICFSVVKHQVGKRSFYGVCTGWLQSLIHRQPGHPSPVSIPIFLKKTPEFSVPEHISSPIIMVGPGTGVAPFISFLQYRRWLMDQYESQGAKLHYVPAVLGAKSPVVTVPEVPEVRTQECTPLNSPSNADVADQKNDREKAVRMYSQYVYDNEEADKPERSDSHSKVLRRLSEEETQQQVVGETHLFFGCKHRDVDYLFREELEEYHKNHTLRYLHTAFSQEEDGAHWYGGVYVQDKMMDVSERLATLICSRDAYIYVCGDAKSMAKDVHRVLIDILCDSRRAETPAEAQEKLAALQERGMYQRDIW